MSIMFHRSLGPLLIAACAGVATLATIAPDGSGPGVTCDELYHVHQGKQLVTALRQQGFAFFLPVNIDRNFSWPPGGPPVQAPLGYWILGWTHYLFDLAPDDPSVVSLDGGPVCPGDGVCDLDPDRGRYGRPDVRGSWPARWPPRPWR